MARQLNVSVEKSNYYLTLLRNSFVSLSLLKDLVCELGRDNEGDVYTLYGRRGRYPDLCSKDKQLRAKAERQAFNFVIQGTEADIVKLIQIRAHHAIKDVEDTYFVLQVHDELIYETKEGNEEELMITLEGIVNTYEYLPGLKVTGHAKFGKNWYEIK